MCLHKPPPNAGPRLLNAAWSISHPGVSPAQIRYSSQNGHQARIDIHTVVCPNAWLSVRRSQCGGTNAAASLYAGR